MYDIIHHWLLSIDNNFNSRSISARSRNKIVNKDNKWSVIRMTLYRGAADRISFNYQWITSFGHLFDSKCQNIEKKKKKEKKKRKKERNGRPGRSSDANKSCTHNSLCVLIFVGLTVLLGRGVQKRRKSSVTVESKILEASSLIRARSAIWLDKSLCRIRGGSTPKGSECLRNFFL